ncbi:DUF6773 family protein [Fusibacter sp. 3D3]|uniref:DUF6773 family protein n=1 Tax=Fusibacter sp. 3D3 TaxID=1048380 RepID=UPI000853C818|nr:DUF6773 family protein [Fusibacter sp. 3D3]GAU79596.1 hypothetical protein F3D3_4260 [Fusibacter sp. 3D3]
MKRQTIQDERVSAQRHKINSEAYILLMIALLASILVQQFWFNASFEQYIAECICFLGISIYTIVRYIYLGLNIWGEGKRVKMRLLVTSTIAGLTVTTINGFSNYTRYADHYQADGIGYFIAVLGVTFISATGIVFVLMMCLDYLNAKKQQKIQKQLDEDEQNL